MRIAIIAPLEIRVPPVAYGGTELVVSLLTEALVNRGHDVTLFASGDSVTGARPRGHSTFSARHEPLQSPIEFAEYGGLPEPGGPVRYHP
jgi:hypothetical protein